MYTTNLDTTEIERKLKLLDSRYRTATLRLDLARLEYFQKREAGDAAQIASAEEKVLDLTLQRDQLRAELDRLEDLH